MWINHVIMSRYSVLPDNTALLIKLLCLVAPACTARPLTTLRKWLMLNYESNLLALNSRDRSILMLTDQIF